MSLKKTSPKSPTPPPLALPIQNETCKTKPSTVSPPASPKLPSPRPPAIKRGKDPNYDLNSSAEKVLTPRCMIKSASSIKKSKNSSGSGGSAVVAETLKNTSSLIIEAPGSIAAARREQVAIMQEQRKMRIAHYGRTKSTKLEGKVTPVLDSSVGREQKRCSYITPNAGTETSPLMLLNSEIFRLFTDIVKTIVCADPIYVAYHDEEWGVPVHDDR